VSRSIQAFDVGATLRELPHLDLTKGVPSADAAQNAFRMLAPFGSGGLIVGGFSGRTPWELHPDTDELLYALDGEVEVTLLKPTKESALPCFLKEARASCRRECGIANTPDQQSSF
jgi:hypothetical protein